MTLKDKIIGLLYAENPGKLPDEINREAEDILYRKDLYERAKALLLLEDE